MITDLLVQQIESCLPYEPNREQSELLQQLAAFVLDGRDDSLFLLRGYAGTGKTSLVGALVKALTQLQSKVVLLAPTGRAAKVFSRYARHPAYTIHRRIYRQKSYSPDMEGFLIGENLAKHTLFIVDEASMIANSVGEGAVYGSGRLLDDLVEYVYSGEHCRLILLGDTAQLLPVGQERSPALDAAVMGGYGLNVVEYELREVARQAAESGILYNATRLRECMEEMPLPRPCLRVNGFPDVEALSGEYLVYPTLTTVSDSTKRLSLPVPINGPIYSIRGFATRYSIGKRNLPQAICCWSPRITISGERTIKRSISSLTAMWPVSCEYLNVPICMVSALPMYNFISLIWKSRWKLRSYWIPLPVSPLL